jgi:hypothetical protein
LPPKASAGWLTAEELKSLETLMKQISDARIPTRYSGFATPSDTDDSELSASAVEGPDDESITANVSELPAAEEESVESSGPLTDLMRSAVEDPDLVSMEVAGSGALEVAGDAAATEAAGGLVGAVEGAIETVAEGAAVVVAAAL